MKYITALICGAAAVLLLTNPNEISKAVCDAIYGCLDIMIPSLFAFTVLSVYLQGSGVARIIFKPFTFVMSRLLRLDETLCCVVLLANVGGYPVGAKLLTGLVKSGRLSAKDASRLMCCCYGSGPAFIIGIVGVRIYGSAVVGVMLFAACFISSLIIAVFVCRSGKRIELSVGGDGAALGFVDAVKSGAAVMMTVCTMIVAFSVITALLDISGMTILLEKLPAILGADDNSGTIVYSLLEISRIKDMMPLAAWVLPICAVLLTFGGACVIVQIAAVVEGKFSLKYFLISRIPAAFISGVLSMPALLLPKVAIECIGGSVSAAEPFSMNIALSASVLIMSGMLLCSAHKEV